MKKILYSILTIMAALSVLCFAACSTGGNVEDDDGSVSDAASDANSTGSSEGGVMSEIVSNVESSLGMGDSSNQNSGAMSSSSK